jgi:ribose 1,5-bisphosphokinase PhnN
MYLVYIAGAPGSGKSALMAELTKYCERYQQRGPYDYLIAASGYEAAELGHRRENFSGTDALSMSIQPKATEWLKTAGLPLVLGEGQRLGNRGFMETARSAGYKTTLVYLDANPGLLEARRNQRGSNQSATWMKGAATAAKNLRAVEIERKADVITLDANLPLEQMASLLADYHPALNELRM